MTTPFENIQKRVEQYLKCNDIAEAFNIDFESWQSHVHYGVDQGFSLLKNRGHLPFIEYEMEDDGYTQQAESGGDNELLFLIRINVGKTFGRTSKLEATKKIKNAQIKFLRQLRDNFGTSVNETDTTSPTAIYSAPWGFYKEFEVGILISYEKEDYGDNIG